MSTIEPAHTNRCDDRTSRRSFVKTGILAATLPLLETPLLESPLLKVRLTGLAAQENPSGKGQRALSQFSMIFGYGYAGDNFPTDADHFEKVVLGVKAANFNTILCKYEESRAAICKKHGIKILADLLVADHHIYKNVEACQTLCQQLRGNDTVLGYHLWSDRVGSRVAGRVRDSDNVHQWDPTHLTYVGTYRVEGNSQLTGIDVHGYYDKHVERGGHFSHLLRAWSASKKIESPFFRYIFYGGQYGQRHNRTSYTIATSIAFGPEGISTALHWRHHQQDQW